MVEPAVEVYVFGFRDAELAEWTSEFGLHPRSLAPEDLGRVPQDVPVIAHARGGAELTRRLEAAGMLNDIFLYLPPGQVVPPPGAYYELAITDQDLPDLPTQLAHPEQFRIRELAEDVPMRLLANPIGTLPLGGLGLPAWASDHLASCPICEGALREALRARVRLYQSLACPRPEGLIAYARRGEDAGGRVGRHISTCPVCASQVKALHVVELPVAVSLSTSRHEPWLAAKLVTRLAGTASEGLLASSMKAYRDLDELRNLLKSELGALFDLFDQARAEKNTGAWTSSSNDHEVREHREAYSANVEPDSGGALGELGEMAELQNALASGVPAVLPSVGKRLQIGWDKDVHAPYLALEDDDLNEVSHFSVEVWHDREVIWSAQTAQGKLLVDPAAIEGALRVYEDQHMLNQDAEYTIALLTGDPAE